MVRMNKGFLCMVLHAHLPYIRHPEHEYFLEENWLYEAVIETYIPLINIFERLADDGVDFRTTLSLSPTLVEMLNDRLLRERCGRHIERLLELSEEEVYRTRRDIHFGPVARMYRNRLRKIRRLFEDVYVKDLVARFRALQDDGILEIISSSATHAFLPSMSSFPQSVKAQIKIGTDLYRKVFGKPPAGIWLPECGFDRGFDGYIKGNGIKFFFLDTHGVVHGAPLPHYGVHAPVKCPSGVFAFGRDAETAKQVWSSVEGYPGDFDYRDFYRDIGFDLDTESLRSFAHPYGSRTYTGLKYYRITGKTDRKKPYVRARAMRKALQHARHFIRNREVQTAFLSEKLGIKPVITAMYDAELFGHWWFEGPEWLDFLFREIHRKERNFRTITPSGYLDSYMRRRVLQGCKPSMSSWGENGYCEVWLNTSNDYVYRHLFKATERMTSLAERFPRADGILRRALNQAVRELLLSQQSDWTFMMKTGNNRGYAERRFQEHINSFNFLCQSILLENIPEKQLAETEGKNRIFQDIDYRVYCSDRRIKGTIILT